MIAGFKPMLAIPVNMEKLDLNKSVMWLSPKLDGCFTESTMVWTEEGLLPIGQIVKKKLKINVASHNETTGEVEFKPVTGWFENGLKDASEWMGFSKSSKITRNHQVFTQSGWKSAMSSGGVGLRVDPNLTAAITGMLLGDSCASIEKRHDTPYSGWRLMWSNCVADVEYGRGKANMLGEWLNTKEKEYISGYGHPQVSFTTSVCRSLPYDLSRFYEMRPGNFNYGKRKEDLSLADIQCGFTDLSLAIWYFDDGCIQSNNGNDSTPRIHFSVARYSDKTLAAFKDLFRTKYGVEPTIEKYGKDIKMSFSSPASVYLLWRIGKAAGALMPRKMIEGVPSAVPTILKELQWLPNLVGNPVNDLSDRKWSAYDIEVKDNHNYFAEGQLVHNCRAIVIDGVVMSRSLKPIPNKHVQNLFGHLEFYDGELIVGDPTAHDVYRKTASGCMSVDGEPDVTFFVFDHIQFPTDEYGVRFGWLTNHENVVVLDQRPVLSFEELEALENKYLDQGYEGVMIRASYGPNSKYKFGRSTVNSQSLLKVKRMATCEATVLDVIELERNMNEATTNALGHTERSSHKANKVGGGTMGALYVKCLNTGVYFQLGTGFSAADRDWWWEKGAGAKGLIITYNHFPVGRKDLPRFPSYKGLRNSIDMSE